ncbi:uromodulin-like 1 [Lampris incognitus]|uniref:uromodulin-like 1 n=1 Tax=Lampris incognitus TaxID=2546036 RepID=UPI0024B4B3C1|nr:uromodulin-like 1 [Lampris incognitus]
MSWMLSIWLAVVLLVCKGHNALFEGYDLSTSGYHLCAVHETRQASVLVTHKVPYKVRRPCGRWLPWKTCEVTLYRMIHRTENKTVTEEVTRCCDGFAQVGSYCALPLNRSREFTAKPGSCPDAKGLPSSNEDCEWDIDCPGWQKCCKRPCGSSCTAPTGSPQYSENRRWHLNVTVTVKIDYQQLMSLDGGLLDHTRMLHAMVTGALDSPAVSVHYVSSQPVHPYRTATSLLVACNATFSLPNATSKLHLLLRHIEEVSSVTVEDVDECLHTSLSTCSPQAECNNTVGSYQCTCHQGYTDAHPRHPGAVCEADQNATTSTEHPTSSPTVLTPISIFTPTMNTTQAVSSATYDSAENSSADIVSSSETSVPAALTPPFITRLWSSNVTGTSFFLYWSSQLGSNHTYLVVLRQESEVVRQWETNQTSTEVTGLQPGSLYNITVTPCACGSRGGSLHLCVKTAAQTLEATARLTNIQFTDDLLNSSSQAYLNLTQTIQEEIYQSLDPKMKAMVDSGEMRIKITSLSQGSVVVNFTIVLNSDQSPNVHNVSSALMSALLNSSKFTVDENNMSIHDFDECTTGENDCSRWAQCRNTWASYECLCLDGFMDTDPARPGRVCEAETTPAVTIPTIEAVGNNTATPDTTIPVHSPQNYTLTTPPSSTTATTSTSSTTGPSSINALTHSSSTANDTHISSTATPTPTSSAIAPTPTIAPTTTSTTIPTSYTITPTPTGSATTPTTTSFSTAPSPTTASTTTGANTPTSSTTTSAPINPPIIPITTLTPNTSSTTAPTPATDSQVTPEDISVECRAAAITVTVTREFLVREKISDSALHLGMEQCGVNRSNATHVQLILAWGECNTTLLHNDTYYSVQVTLFDSMVHLALTNGTAEAPKPRLEVPIMCTYRKSILVSTGYGPKGYDMIKDAIVGSGTFHVTVQLLNGDSPLPQNHTLTPEEDVVVKVSLNTTAEQIKVVINSCWATPSTNPLDSTNYIFLGDGCPMPNMYTTVLENGNSSSSRLSVRIFSFVELDVAYLHCQVQICVETGSTTCVPDCTGRMERFANTIGTAYGCSGPLLRSDLESTEEALDVFHVVGFSLLGIGTTLVFLGGFIAVFYYQRNRIGHYNFSLKAKEEKFTYLVFNT